MYPPSCVSVPQDIIKENRGQEPKKHTKNVTKTKTGDNYDNNCNKSIKTELK